MAINRFGREEIQLSTKIGRLLLNFEPHEVTPEAICSAHNTPLIEAALQFVLGHHCVKTVVPGAVSAAEVQANVTLMDQDIPTELWSGLRAEGLIRSDVPLPAASNFEVKRPTRCLAN